MFTFLSFDSFMLTGENVRRWCNGMFSNNIRALQPAMGNKSALCDDRGRIIGFVDAYCVDDTHFQCVLNGSSLEWFQEKFKMVLFLDDIEIEDEQDSLIHLFGDNLLQICKELNWPEVSNGSFHKHEDCILLGNNRYHQNGIDIIASSERLTQLREVLTTLGQQELTATEVNDLRIQRSVPQFPNDFSEKSFIHEYGLADTHCSFNKGCYVGQEIINRMDLKKLAPRKLCLLKIEGTAEIGRILQKDGIQVGEISSVSQSIPRYGLAVLKKTAAEIGNTFEWENGEATIDVVVE